MRPTKAIINLACLEQNIKALRGCLKPGIVYMAVVKADAYGHGIVPVSRHALKCGAGCLGVAIPEEGALLREAGINAPILVLGSIDEHQAETVAQYGLTQAVASLDVAQCLAKVSKQAGKRINIHIKLDTGMGRIGFRKENELASLIDLLSETHGIDVEGVFTHFADADGSSMDFTKQQLEAYLRLTGYIESSGLKPRLHHCANSAAIVRFADAHFNMVRGGISMYGYSPGGKNDKSGLPLQPVLSWVTRIVHIKTITQGESISYGRTFVAQGSTRVATLPVGYGDGYRRCLSNRGFVLIHGKRAPVIGRVCMDQLMVDITDIRDAAVGDEAVLIGSQGRETITADDLAELCGTISYEILTGIMPRIPREYTGG